MGFINKFKEMMGLEEDFYEDEEYMDDYNYENSSEYADVNSNYNSQEPIEDSMYETNENTSYERATRRGDNIVSMGNTRTIGSDSVRIVIHEPITFEDAPVVLDDILSRKVLVLNLEMLEMDLKNKIFDFVSGGIYALDGKMQKVTKDIFVLAPNGIDIDGKIKDQIQSKGFYQL